MKVVILNGGFGRQLTHDIIVDTIRTKLNRKSTDAKSGAGGDARRLGSHTHILRGRHGREYVNPGLVKVNNTTHLEHLYIMLRRCERLHLPRDLFIVGKVECRTIDRNGHSRECKACQSPGRRRDRRRAERSARFFFFFFQTCNVFIASCRQTFFTHHRVDALGKVRTTRWSSSLAAGNDAVRTVMDEWCGESDVAFPTANVLYNGLDENTMDQQSDVADLALAIDHFKLAETKCPLLVITADTAFFQDYRFGRVLEHSFVRNKDVVATYDLTPGQVECDPNGAPIVQLIGDQKAVMGKVKSVKLEQLVNTGRALAPVMTLHRSTVGTVRGYLEAGCRNVHELFKSVWETKGDQECYAIDLGFGRFDCVTLESLRYCEEFNLFYTAQRMVLNKLARTQDTDSSLDFKTSRSGRGDGSKEMNQVQGYGDMKPDLANAIKIFIKGHFQERTAALSGKMAILTPSSFYQTEYTRNTPVVTPRPTPLGRSLG